jgi:hypothetical protein
MPPFSRSKPSKAEIRNKMNIYYTAKDIEELVAKGIYELELGPNTSLTDFARETAEQLDVTLLDGAQTAPVPNVPAPTASAVEAQAVSVSQRYNKPRGCQSGKKPVQSIPSSVANIEESQSSTAPVNRLVDLMGKIINRGD